MDYNEALAFNTNAYIASSPTDPPTGGSLAGEQEPVHSLALLHSIENALVSGGDKVRAPFAQYGRKRAIVRYHVLIASLNRMGTLTLVLLLCTLVNSTMSVFFNT